MGKKSAGDNTSLDKSTMRRPIDYILSRPAETPEEFDARMKREGKFLKMQREIITPLVGHDKAKHIDDYYEAGLPRGLFRMLSGLPAIEYFFIEHNVLGEELTSRVNHFSLKTKKETGKFDNFSKNLFIKYFVDYNPDVLISNFIYPARVDGTGANFFVLKKKDMRPGERRQMIQRAEALLDVLRYSGEYYHYKNRHDPWEELILNIEGLAARAGPMENKKYIKTGKVFDYAEPNEYRHESGYVAENADENVILTNCDDVEKFAYLKGKIVRYHFKGYKGMGFPVGDMIADKLTIPVDDTLQLPPASY
jgi:hypothetical protein